ncbi:hypothetical protein AC578_3512 [Lecanosticta acicola]|uniref:Zinc finger PHD-type domain-containing protein n=1 Tax=Lecanosticta acicola TaxID=111012 RepID=A0AAI8W1Q7_9PEZI|nr:hypothetical protein AC578_3512 [Lecanosticta acicola]
MPNSPRDPSRDSASEHQDHQAYSNKHSAETSQSIVSPTTPKKTTAVSDADSSPLSSPPSILEEPKAISSSPPAARTSSSDTSHRISAASINTALEEVGYQPPPTAAAPAETFCICLAPADVEIDQEELTRCSNRHCGPGWFHLKCVKLPDHPPITFRWYCAQCIKKGRISGAVSGLVDHRHPQSGLCREWVKKERLREADEKKMAKALEKLESRRAKGEGDEAVENGDETGKKRKRGPERHRAVKKKKGVEKKREAAPRAMRTTRGKKAL